MSDRDDLLQQFLTRLVDAIRSDAIGAEASAAIDRIEGALQKPGRAGAVMPQRLTVCGHLTEALATARSARARVAHIADSFAALEPSLAWIPRHASGRFASANWPEGHANATIVGPKGLEERNDLAIGASLLAPHVRYPDHSHGPEEVYLVLMPGRFQHGDSVWFEPGIGGTLYNEPNIKHAMASDDAPLFALWCLWTGEACIIGRGPTRLPAVFQPPGYPVDFFGGEA